MGYKNQTKKREAGSHLSYMDCQKLEWLIREDERNDRKSRPQRLLAEALGVSRLTISRELRRGAVKQMDSQLSIMLPRKET